MTLKQARKILGELGKDLSDEEIRKELEDASFLSELLLERYQIYKKAPNIESKNAESSYIR